MRSEQQAWEAIRAFVRSVLAREGENLLSIMLFGSRARGEHTCYSDADLLVVLAESGRRFIDRLSDFATLCPDGLVEPLGRGWRVRR